MLVNAIRHLLIHRPAYHYSNTLLIRTLRTVSETPIWPTTSKLNTADGSPVTALGMTALHMRIVEFRFTHNLVICNRLLDMKIIFGIDIQKKFSLSYAWDKEKKMSYTKGW